MLIPLEELDGVMRELGRWAVGEEEMPAKGSPEEMRLLTVEILRRLVAEVKFKDAQLNHLHRQLQRAGVLSQSGIFAANPVDDLFGV